MILKFLREDILFLFLIFSLCNLVVNTNVCENQPNDAFIKDPNNCENFFQCRNGIALPATCPDGMYFDPQSGICDIANNVFCEHDYIDPEDKDEDNDEFIDCPNEENKKEITFFASRIDCNRYYICYHGTAIKQECIPQLHWNNKTMKCDYPDKAKCTINNIKCGVKELNKRNALPHPINCSLYYYCISGIPLLQRCPYYHHFDIQNRSCIWENKARCWAKEKLKQIAKQKILRSIKKFQK